MMSSPGLSSGTPKPADLFEGLWRQLGECHQSALQELEAKVSKLKKERCLDAERLEVFYNRHQQVKERNKSLQDAISLLEERLRAGECDRCAALGESLKNNQEQNLQLIAQLRDERNSLQDENRKLNAELQKLKTSRSLAQQDSSPEQEEGFIPDSPVLPSSLPVANKLKKRKNIDKMKRVRYAEVSRIQSNNSLFNDLYEEPAGATKSHGRAEVLVPDTCQLETSQTLIIDKEDVIAETCALDLLNRPPMTHEAPADQQSTSKSPWRNCIQLKPYSSSLSSTLIHSPDSTTERSPSLLPSVKRLSVDGSINRAKRKKEEIELEIQAKDKQGNQEGVDEQKEGKHTQPGLTKRTSAPLHNQSLQKRPLDCMAQGTQTGMQRSNISCASPAFKKPNVRERSESNVGKRRNPLQDLTASHQQLEEDDAENKHNVEPMWSIDPALALSMYDSEWRGDEEKEEQCDGDMQDTDCTWVSHSLLQRHGVEAREKRDSVGLGQRANDSLDLMFDTSAYGEYKSCNSPHMGQSQQDEGDEDDDDVDGNDDEDIEEDGEDPHENTMSQMKGHKAGRPTFAHVAVVRKKDERRKLKGTTCKECEIYYAHLPEEEKQKKLSSCSRHRFLYIPPCTPDNFWEVGFPSTQTCIERGYIKEEKNPQARTRRRQPFNALFTPKKNQQES